jgi:hypothetical protein
LPFKCLGVGVVDWFDQVRSEKCLLSSGKFIQLVELA